METVDKNKKVASMKSLLKRKWKPVINFQTIFLNDFFADLYYEYLQYFALSQTIDIDCHFW